MEKFTVKRSQWLRGEGPDESRLLRLKDRKMCCLGFAALSCGLEPEDIEAKDSPSALLIKPQTLPKWFPKLVTRDGALNSAECIQIMGINDQPAMSEPDREAHLIRLFADIGVEVTFED